MMEPDQKLRVFLCHSSRDKTSVRKLYQRLKTDGFSPWLDEEDLIPGQNWQQEISRAVRMCQAVIVCLSTNSISKEGFVQKEIKIALDVADEKPEGTIFIIPARLEEVQVPMRLSQWHWVNLFEENGYAKLVHALSMRFKELGIIPMSKAGPDVQEEQLTERRRQESERAKELAGRAAQKLAEPWGLTREKPEQDWPAPQQTQSKPESVQVKIRHEKGKATGVQWRGTRKWWVTGMVAFTIMAAAIGIRVLPPYGNGRPQPTPTPITVKTNAIDGQKYVWMAAGTFQMGCSPGDECYAEEKPAHAITIRKGFWLEQTPVTQAAYQRVMNANPSRFHGDQLPVESVT